MTQDDREWDQHHREVRHRLSWTGLVANGALIIAIVGGGAQADDFLQVLHSMALPLTVFGAGAALGLIGEEIALKADIEWKRGSAWWEDPEGPAKEVARLNKRVRELLATGALQQPSPELLQEFKGIVARTAELSPVIQVNGERTRGMVKRSITLSRVAAPFRWGSLALCAAGFATMLGMAMQT